MRPLPLAEPPRRQRSGTSAPTRSAAPKAVPQNKDLSDNWPEWFEGLQQQHERRTRRRATASWSTPSAQTALFPQATLTERLAARDAFVQQTRPRENSRSDQPPRSQRRRASDRLLRDGVRPDPVDAERDAAAAEPAARSSRRRGDGGARSRGGQRAVHQRGQRGRRAAARAATTTATRSTNGAVDDTFQDFNIHEPGVISGDHRSTTTARSSGSTNDYFFKPVRPAAGCRQPPEHQQPQHPATCAAFWDGVPRWLHHGSRTAMREILLRARLAAAAARRARLQLPHRAHRSLARVAADFLGGPPIVLPTEVPITHGSTAAARSAGDGKGPILVSLDRPVPGRAAGTRHIPDGRLQIDRLGSDNLAPLIVVNSGRAHDQPGARRQQHRRCIKDTHGKTSQLNAADIEALSMYLKSLQK